MNQYVIRKPLLIFCLVSLCGYCPAQQVGAKPVLTPAPVAASSTPSTAPAPVAPGGALTISASYVIGAGDVLKIDVWKETQLSGPFPVRPDGKITLPLINDITAAGYTPMQLQADITARLTKFLTDPVVDVGVQQVNSKVVFMVGEVSRAGPMQISPGMTILQAVASAGLSPYANRKHIYILRGDPNHQKRVNFDYNRAVKKGDMQGVTLIPGDTIVVP